MSTSINSEEYMSELVGYAYSVAEPSNDALGSFRRKWVLRIRDDAAEEPEFARIVNKLQEQARSAVIEAYGEPVSRPENLPSVRGVRVDASHVVVEIACPGPGNAVGDTAGIASAWCALRNLDKLWCIGDLEGIPKRYRFALRYAFQQESLKIRD